MASDASGVTLASARHTARVRVGLEQDVYQVQFLAATPTLLLELQRGFPPSAVDSGGFTVTTESALAALLRRAASLARALPNQAAPSISRRWRRNWRNCQRAWSARKSSV